MKTVDLSDGFHGSIETMIEIVKQLRAWSRVNHENRRFERPDKTFWQNACHK